MMRTPRLTVVGSVNIDLVACCERLPRPGETVGGAVFERFPGGKGANQAVAAARLGAAVEMVGAVGSDAFGEELLVGLSEAEVDTARVSVAEAPTGAALILVDQRGETEIVVAPGANAHLAPSSVVVGEHDAVLCQLEIPVAAVAAAAEACRGLFCLNAAPAGWLPPEIVARADLVVVNRLELEALEVVPPRLVALTLGAEGAILLEEGQEVARARAPSVRALDGTAAGDAFCACLVVSLLEGLSRPAALERACVAGAVAASRRGAQPSLPTTAEIDALWRR